MGDYPPMKTWEAAIEVLRETDNPAVMWGDEGLLHLIAKRTGRKYRGGWETSDRVLATLRKTPGDLVPGMTRLGNGRLVSIFVLPECANDRKFK